MKKFDFTATAHVTIRVVAENEDAACRTILENLQSADTDFVRTDHWPTERLVAEFALSNVAPTTPTKGAASDV